MTHKVVLDFPESSYKRLHTLIGKTEAASEAEVIGNALRLYEAAIEASEKGMGFYQRHEAEGNVSYLPVALLVDG